MRFGLEVIARSGGSRIRFPYHRPGGGQRVHGRRVANEEPACFPGIEKAGANMINVTGGCTKPGSPDHQGLPGAVRLSRPGISRPVSIPVMACNRISDHPGRRICAMARRLDRVCRGLIADPELPNKARRGASTKSLLYCLQQGCFDPIFEGKPQTCLVNARAGGKKEGHRAGFLQGKRSWSSEEAPPGWKPAGVAA